MTTTGYMGRREAKLSDVASDQKIPPSCRLAARQQMAIHGDITLSDWARAESGWSGCIVSVADLFDGRLP